MSKVFDTNEDDLLRNIDQRLKRIESVLNLEPISFNDEAKNSKRNLHRDNQIESDRLELQIGQFWFAKAGMVVLALGIIFLLTLPYESLHPAVPSLLGYTIMVFIFVAARFTKNNFEYLSKYLFGAGLLLLYFSTMRLHYFSADPVIPQIGLVVVFLTIVSLIHSVAAIKKHSVYLTGIGVFLFYLTALISDNPYILFIFLSLTALLVTYLKIKRNWNGLLILSVILTFMFHLNWFSNNPLIGNKLSLLNSPVINLFFILLYVIIFSMGILLTKQENVEGNLSKWISFLVAVGGFITFLLISILRFRSELVLLHLFSFFTFLGIAIMFWVKKESQYSTFFYSILGYTSLSVAIISMFPVPDFFVWLCWQSLIVIITAIWFRSKIVIVANFIIYLGLFLGYIVMANELQAFTLSYGVIALVSARILNWRKEKLQLKTDMMRMAYLAVAFFVFPYTLYKVLPEGYVAISWIVVASLYYVLSLLLRNNKYRWMALLTILLTVGYLLIIGTTQLEPVFRIISFLVLGITLLIISIVYAKRKTKVENET